MTKPLAPPTALRARRLGPSMIRRLSEGAPAGAIPLGLGEPSWDLPAPARRALAAVDGPCGYGPNAGLPELRQAIAGRYRASVDEVAVTTGAEGALFSLFQAWLDPGDAVLVPDPGIPAYTALAELCGARTVPYALQIAHPFRLDPAGVLAALEREPRVRVVVVNAPGNPTGGGASVDALRRVAAACEDRSALLISDEVYADLYFVERGPGSRDVATSGVVVSSVSKGWAAPGLRVGWMVGSPAWIEPARAVHAHAVTAASLVCQRAALALLETSDAVLAQSRRELAARFQALSDAASEHWGWAPERPDGTFYAWVALPATAAADPEGFCFRLRDEAGVVITPGIAFGDNGRGRGRLSFGARPEQIREGVRRLAPVFSR